MIRIIGHDGRKRDSPSLMGSRVVLSVVSTDSDVSSSLDDSDLFIAIGPLLGAAFVELATEFDVPLSTFISGVQGGLIVAIAFGSLVCNALAVKFGKRPIYLITTIGLTVTCFWAAAAKSFVSLVAARVVQGFCMGPLEALVPASIADVW
jgi:MFS family permease